MKNLCIIPARAGSKRIANKNIKPLAGVPLISWTIRAALNSKVFDKIIISTDSSEIANIAEREGVPVGSLRPANLATDQSTASEVIAYHLRDIRVENICYLQPTSPLRSEVDVVESYIKLTNSGADSVISVTDTGTPYSWLYEQDSSFEEFMVNVSTKRSQDLKPALSLNGAIYWFKFEAFKKNGTHLLTKNTLPYVMPKGRSVDIDELEDFQLAEILIKKNG